MMDFLFSTETGERTARAARDALTRIGARTAPAAVLSGGWGTLAYSPSLYPGFQAIEEEDGVFLVAGAPFWPGEPSAGSRGGPADTAFSRALLEAYRRRGTALLPSLDGPFLIAHFDWRRQTATLITDRLSFLPVYQVMDPEGEALRFGSHADALASVAGMESDWDAVSLADLFCHAAVCAPHTTYRRIRQLAPGTAHGFSLAGKRGTGSPSYWVPREEPCPCGVAQAAVEVREGLRGHLCRVAARHSEARLFLSGGEDSRLIAALMPGGMELSGVVVADGPNREELLARRVAQAFRIPILAVHRPPTHYLDILGPSVALTGSAHQYAGGHFVGLEEAVASGRPGVFLDGFLADALFKGADIAKAPGSRVRGFHVLPERKSPRTDLHPPAFLRSMLHPDMLRSLEERWEAHHSAVRRIRPESWLEWSALWPIGQSEDFSHLRAESRQFPVYGPFRCNACVEWSARMPQEWKLNRLFFQKMARPALRPVWRMPHSNGSYPYFPSAINRAVLNARVLGRKVRRRGGANAMHQGPWGDIGRMSRDPAVRRELARCAEAAQRRGILSGALPPGELVRKGILERSETQRWIYRLLQTGHLLSPRG